MSAINACLIITLFACCFSPPFCLLFSIISSVQFISVTQSCSTLWDPRDCSMPGFPVHHQLLETTQIHVHWVSDAIQTSHPLLSPSPPTFNLSQHQVFSNESVLCIRWPKNWGFSFNISPYNEYSGLISFRMDLLAVKGLSRVFSNTTVQKHQLFSAQLSLWTNSHIHTWLLEKPYPWLDKPLLAK